MFQVKKTNRDNLLSKVSLNILLSVLLLTLPTSFLLILIGSKTTKLQDGAVYVDLNLGFLLLFSSLATILTPCLYRPVSILYATHLAKKWITASATTTFKGTSYLPSTPQYLLAVGNLGISSTSSLYKSFKYYIRRRQGGGVSPIFTHSAICLAGLYFMTGMVVIGDIWLHLASTCVVDPLPGSPAIQGQMQDQGNGVGNASRVFAAPATPDQAPWRLQQGLQTFLDVNSLNTVRKINTTTVLIPKTIPPGIDMVGSTLGIEMTCELLNTGCTFSQSAPSTSLTWDCSSIQSGALGIIPNPDNNPVNTTLLLSPSTNTTNFTIISAMGISSLFNSSTAITVAQVFRCTGSLLNITYTVSSGVFTIVNKLERDTVPLVELMNLDSVPGKRGLLGDVGKTVAQSTVLVKGMSVAGIGAVYADGLGRMFVSFLSGETVPAPSLKESPTTFRTLSRIPLAPLLFLSILIALSLLLLLTLSLLSLFAILRPPTLNGNPISILNLHKQLISPMDVLATTLGDSPLAMKVLFRGNEEGRVRFDILQRGSTDGGETVTKGDSSLRSLYSAPGEDDGGSGEYDGRDYVSDIRFDPTPLGSGRFFEGTDGDRTPRSKVNYPTTDNSSGSTPRSYYHAGQRYQRPEESNSGGSGWERFGPLPKRSGSGELPEQGMEELSDEENRVFLGMQQRQEARDSGDEVGSTSTPRSNMSPRGIRTADGVSPRENRL